MTQKKIYVTLSQFCDSEDRPRRFLREAGFLVQENKTGRRMKQEELLNVLHDIDAVIAGVEPYNEALLSQLPRLKLISRVGIGTDSIDLDAAKKCNIAIRVTADEVAEPVAQMALAMILALARNFSLHLHDFRNNIWRKHTGFLLSELKIGLIGFGRIARLLEIYLRPFGCHIFVVDPFLKAKDVPQGVELCDLDFLLTQSDLISLHASRNKKEGFLLGHQEFLKMKKGAFLVNTARGYLVDEKALTESLQSGHLAGAALDVFENEPYSGLLTHFPNVLCTSHVGTLTQASRIAMEVKCAQNVVSFFNTISR